MANVHLHAAKTKRRSIIYFEIGMILALTFTLWAFNISNSTSDIVVDNYSTSQEDPIIEFQGPITIETDELKTTSTTKTRITDQFQIVPDPDVIPDPGPAPSPTPDPTTNPGTIVIAPQVSGHDPGESNDPVIVASQMPSFPGGEEAMMKFILNEVEYPPLALENGITGRVTVTFVVEKDGSISNVQVVKSLGWGIDEEAIRVVKAMPRWTPGENNFRPVRVRIALPIKFMFK